MIVELNARSSDRTINPIRSCEPPNHGLAESWRYDIRVNLARAEVSMKLAVRMFACGVVYIVLGVPLLVVSPVLNFNSQPGYPAAIAAGPTESKADRADRLRKESRARSVTGIGYEVIGAPDDTKPYPMDYHALGSIISRLGTIIQQMDAAKSRSIKEGPHIPGLPGGGQETTSLSRTYGPGGPTVKSVRALLSYRLVTLGNANLQVGTVKDHKAHIVATVVTRENSLVANYKVDKKTGIWRQVNAIR